MRFFFNHFSLLPFTFINLKVVLFGKQSRPPALQYNCPEGKCHYEWKKYACHYYKRSDNFDCLPRRMHLKIFEMFRGGVRLLFLDTTTNFFSQGE